MSEASKDFFLKQIEIGPMKNYAYLVGSKKAKEVFIVDPGWDAEVLLAAVKKELLSVKGILVTHCHYDHVNGLDELTQALACPIYVHSKDAPFMGKWIRRLQTVEDGFQLSVGEVQIGFIHTPGHTSGSQCFLTEDHLISGDTLFVDACGRCDLPGGDARQMKQSLRRLSELPDQVILCPGHDYGGKPTDTMGNQKKSNPFLLRSLHTGKS